MKKLVLILMFVTVAANAQWQPDVRLTNNTATSVTTLNSRCIASIGDDVHVVWRDNRDGNTEIYYKRSDDNGKSWGADTRLTNNTTSSYDPSIAVFDSVVHIVWIQFFDLYYIRSTDRGISWGTDIRLTNNPAKSTIPNIAVSDSIIHVVWYDERETNGEIFYKRSTDMGITWEADTRLTNTIYYSTNPSISVYDSLVCVAWQDFSDGNDEIYYKRSTNNGVSWETDTRLTNNSEISEYPCVAVSGSTVHVVWDDYRHVWPNLEIYYKTSNDGGITWSADTRLTDNSGHSSVPSIAVIDSFVHVVWDDTRNGSEDIYYKGSVNGGNTWGADIRLTNNNNEQHIPSVSVSGSAVHVVWRDYRDGNYEIYYKRNPTGNIIGIININSEISNEFSLSQNYPNPFNPSTKIQFALPKSSFAKLVIYDALGRELKTIVSEQLNAGTYEADWNASNYPSGVYFYKLSAEDYSGTKKMVLVK